MGSFPRWPAVRQVVGCEKIRLRRIIQNVIAGIDPGMEVGVDEAGRDEAASGIDRSIHGFGVDFAGKKDSIAFERHHAVFEDFVFLAVETDDKSALDNGLHGAPYFGKEFVADLTDKARQDKLQTIRGELDDTIR